MADDDHPSLERTISVGGSALLSFNGLLGAAIFALPATLLADWGSFSPWLFLIVAVAALLVIVPFTLSAAAFTESGGPATYGLVFGRFTGFELGWIYYVAKVAGTAANLNVLADYVARWWAAAGEGLGRIAAILITWIALTVINLFGMKRAIAFLGGFTVLKALPLIAVALAALVLFGPPPPPMLPNQTGSPEAGFLVIFYAFVGFENAVVPTGETKDPRSTLPRAVGLTIIVTALLYFVVQLGFVAAFEGAELTSKAPIIDLGALVAGSLGAVILTLAAICSLLGNLLSGSASTPRVTYAMGSRGDLPAWFGAVSPKFQSPSNSILFFGAIVAFLAVILTLAAVCSLLGNLLSGSASTPRVTYAMGSRGDLPAWFGAVSPKFQSPSNSILFFGAIVAFLAVSGSFVWLAVVSTLARLILYPITIAALPLAPNRARVSGAYWLAGMAGIAICVWGITQANAQAWATLFALCLVGIVLFVLATKSVRKSRAT